MTTLGRWAGVAATCAGLFLASEPAAAAPSWIPISFHPDYTWFYDANSVTGSDGRFVVDVKRVMQSDLVADNGRRYRMVEMTAEYDCRRHITRTGIVTGYDKDGGIAFSGSPNVGDQPIVEESVDATMERIVCKTASLPVKSISHIGADEIARARWLVTATASTGGAEVSVDIASAEEFKPGVVAALVREYGSAARLSPSGAPYYTAYYLDLFGCKTQELAIMAADYYDFANTLVDSKDYSKKPLFVDLRDGSVGGFEKLAACRAVEERAKQTAKTKTQPAADDTVYSSGTGWLEAKGYVITADHVVRDAVSLMLVQDGKPVGKAEIVAEDPANDIAVLRPSFTDGAHPAIALRDGPASLGEAIFTLGYPAPDAMGLAIKTTSGEVSALSGNDVANHRTDDVRFMQISAPVQSGNSGGPVLGPDGKAVGMVISKVEKTSDDDVAQNVNYALKIGYVKGLLSDLPALTRVREVEDAPSRVELISALRGAVFLIVAESPPAP